MHLDEAQAFKEIFAEDLRTFGWQSVTAEDIPGLDQVGRGLQKVIEFWNGLSQTGRDVLQEIDLSDGLWTAGLLGDWPLLYNLLHGLPFERNYNTISNIQDCACNAHDRAPDYAARHAVGGGVAEVDPDATSGT